MPDQVLHATGHPDERPRPLRALVGIAAGAFAGVDNNDNDDATFACQFCQRRQQAAD